MITKQLLTPRSIAVIGGSNDITKPGGKLLHNLLLKKPENLYVVNIKDDTVQGIKCHKSVADLPQIDLAIICIACDFCEAIVTELCEKKDTKAIVIVSAGFSEVGHEGKLLERRIVDICNSNQCCLIGPNCIGMLTPSYNGVFAGPVPKLTPNGCDFVTSSGATACFILEEAIMHGVPFASVYSVGNGAQVSVEDVLEYWDTTHCADSPTVKLIYIESVSNPAKLLKHSKSLIAKGCKIAGIKSGTSSAGSRAASSHTGALAGSDVFVDALFKKAGIIRCEGRFELVNIAAILLSKPLKGNNIAIVTHAGGPGVMLTDTLSNNGMNVPQIEGEYANKLLTELYHGSSVSNPIDFLATGTATHLNTILTYIDKHFDSIDGTAVIYGTAGILPPDDIYQTVLEHIKSDSKPIFHIIPSPYLTAKEMKNIFAKGHFAWTDEVAFGKTLAKVYNHYNKKKPEDKVIDTKIDKDAVRKIIDNAPDGYLPPTDIQKLLDSAGIPRAKEAVISNITQLDDAIKNVGFPIVMKVVGPIHKSDVGGVKLNIIDNETAKTTFNEMINITDATGVLIQPMLTGTQLFIGAKKEHNEQSNKTGFGHIILCGMGGIFIEVLKDIQYGLVPLSFAEAKSMIQDLKSYKIIEGVRGQTGINQELFAEIIVRLSALLEIAPEITELDLNPLLATDNSVIAVDARIRIN